ncbi:ABC transporter permease subunit [Neobacillus drentensis]|uniref:ABC transporter permease subunit n=1 Tax=Neobacillus drentensis TaxID=220684 RepID=UPI002FFEC7F0
MIKRILYLPVRFIASLLGFVIVVNIPILLTFNGYQNKIEIKFHFFKEYVTSNIIWFTHLDEYPFIVNYLKGPGIEKYFYTMTIISISILIVILLGLFIATSIMLLPPSARNRFSHFIDFTTTAPDLLVIFLLQYLVMYLNRNFDLNIFQLYGGTESRPYFMPILIIVFLPTIFLIQHLLKEFVNEEQQDYVLLARSKGLPLRTIYFKHILRNIVPLIIIHLKTIIWFMLSNIFIVEHLFNIEGYSTVLQSMYGTRVVVFVVGLLLFAIPLLIIHVLSSIMIMYEKRKETTTL